MSEKNDEKTKLQEKADNFESDMYRDFTNLTASRLSYSGKIGTKTVTKDCSKSCSYGKEDAVRGCTYAKVGIVNGQTAHADAECHAGNHNCPRLKELVKKYRNARVKVQE